VSTIHQIYCTHCTYGSSALERRSGELSHRMLGYSVRAGSLEADDLRRYYRQVERYAYYYLPRDTPGEEKLRLTAATAPRRMIYVPSAGGLQVLGQVCYRQTDTEGRPGSYFAHLLLRQQRDGRPPWSALECLKLWGAAGWVREDSPDISLRLPTLAALDEMLAGAPPTIDDHVFLSYLTAPAGGPFYDPGGVIPPRWRSADAAERRQVFTAALSALAALSARQRGALLVVVEPSMAALFFYGLLRLTPAAAMREGISFSTFEPDPDRQCTTLAATWFHDPEKADFRLEGSGARGLATDTRGRRLGADAQPPSLYAGLMVEKLAAAGWGAVDRTLWNMQSAGARSFEDLERLASIDALVPALMAGRDLPPGYQWRQSPLAMSYLRRVLVQEVSGRQDVAATLQRLVGRPAHLAILELLCAEAETPGTRTAVDYLLQNLREEQLPELLRLGTVPPERKVALLARYVTAHGDLPPGCEQLWDDVPRGVPEEAGAPGVARVAGPPVLPETLAGKLPAPPNADEPPVAPTGLPLLPLLLAWLAPDAVMRFYRNVADRRFEAFLAGLREARWLPGTGASALTPIVRSLDALALMALYRKLGADFLQQYPHDEPALGEKLHALLRMLPDRSDEFSEGLDVLLAGEHLLPSDEDVRAAAAWQKCRRAILEIGKLQARKTGVFGRRPLGPLETACRQMAEALASAWPAEVFPDDQQGTKKRDFLRRIGPSLLGGEELLPAAVPPYNALWQKIGGYFEAGKWSAAGLGRIKAKPLPPLPSAGKRPPVIVSPQRALTPGPSPVTGEGSGSYAAAMPRPRHPPWIFLGVAAGLMALVLGVLAWMRLAGQGSRQAVPAAARSDDETSAEEKRLAAKAPGAQEAKDKAAKEKDGGRGTADGGRQAEEAQAKEDAKPVAKSKKQEEEDAQQAPVAKPKADQDAPERAAAAAKKKVADEEQWRQQARQFAKEHGGAFLENLPLAGGLAQIPQDALPVESDCSRMILGPGRLEIDDGTFEFGQGFDQPADAPGHEIPKLAERLGYPQVWVEVQPRAEGFYLVARIEPKTPSQENDRALQEWKDRRGSITAVVYPDPAPAKMERDPFGTLPEWPAPADNSRKSRVEQVEGDLLVEPGELRSRLDAPYKGQVKVHVVLAQGVSLLPWVKGELGANCEIREYTAYEKQSSYQVLDLRRPKPHPVLRQTVKMEIRFEFCRQAGKGKKAMKVAQTRWYAVEAVGAEKEYNMVFRVTKEAADKLKAI